MTSYQEDVRAQARRDNGITRELEQRRTSLPHPAIGGSRGYPVWFRIDQLARHVNQEPTLASTWSLHRWHQRVHPHRMAGGTERRNLVGRDQMLLTICLLVYPEAEADELAVFIVDHGGDVYSRSVISRRMSEMLSTMKSASSTEAYQAFTPRNLLRERLFWTNPLPLGINGVFRRLFIDVDECGIALERCNRKKGHGMTGLRLRKPGHYTRDTKLTILMAIEPGNPALAAHIDCSDHFRGNESSRFQHQRVERPDDSKKSPTSGTASTRHHSNSHEPGVDVLVQFEEKNDRFSPLTVSTAGASTSSSVSLSSRTASSSSTTSSKTKVDGVKQIRMTDCPSEATR